MSSHTHIQIHAFGLRDGAPCPVHATHETWDGSIRSQLEWCAEEGVPLAIFTHCGSEIVRGDGRVLNARLRRLACEHSLRAEFAFGGLVVVPGEDD